MGKQIKGYNDGLVSLIAKEYAMLTLSLKDLRELRADKDGACLNYVTEIYATAKRAYDFLTSEQVPSTFRDIVNLGELEQELLSFGNTPVRL